MTPKERNQLCFATGWWYDRVQPEVGVRLIAWKKPSPANGATITFGTVGEMDAFLISVR